MDPTGNFVVLCNVIEVDNAEVACVEVREDESIDVSKEPVVDDVAVVVVVVVDVVVVRHGVVVEVVVIDVIVEVVLLVVVDEVLQAHKAVSFKMVLIFA